MHPIFLHLGFLTLPTFGVLTAIGLMLALSLSLRTAAVVGVKPDLLWNAGLFTLLAAFVLSRTLLVLTNLQTFWAYPIILLMVPSLTPLGLLLTAFATLVYLRARSLPILASLDAWAPCGTLIWTFLALGHFAEGSDPGLPSNLPWAIAMPGTVRQHPVAIYAAIAAIGITLVLLTQLPRRRCDGDTTALAFALSGLVQFLLSFFREPALYPGTLGNLLDPVQWLALGMMIFAGILWLRPGRVAIYAV